MSEDTFDKENELQGGEGHSDYKPADTSNDAVSCEASAERYVSELVS